jgi:hypothetical protein
VNRSIPILACAWFLLCNASAFGASWGTVVFRHDFDTSVGGMPDPDVWVVNHPGIWWWTQGRTHFPNPDPWLPTGEFPRVENGICIIRHHHYNPWDLGDPNEWFLGGEIRTVREFAPDRAYRIEAKVRSHPYPNGLVTSFFAYGWDGAQNDEIDFEFVSNGTNDDTSYPSGDPVLANAFDDAAQKPRTIAPEGLDLSEWNTFRIYWDPDLNRIDWSWIDPLHGETWLRTETDAFFVPDEPMALYFNFWAPCYTSWGHGCPPWDEAADAILEPVNQPNENEIHEYAIDYVEVAVLGQPVPALPAWSLIAMAALFAAAGGRLLRQRRLEG